MESVDHSKQNRHTHTHHHHHHPPPAPGSSNEEAGELRETGAWPRRGGERRGVQGSRVAHGKAAAEVRVCLNHSGYVPIYRGREWQTPPQEAPVPALKTGRESQRPRGQSSDAEAAREDWL